jgi:hypothetical protein
LEGCRIRKVRLRKITPIKGNHPQIWREHAQNERKVPLFMRYLNGNAKDMVNMHV